MAGKSNSDLKIFPFDSKTTLHRAIKNYLETRNSRIDRWLLDKFEEKNSNVSYVKDIKANDFDRFLSSLSVSPTSLKSYASRLKRFQEYIGLSQVTVKKKHNPKNDQDVILELQKKVTKAEKERDEKERERAAHSRTIDEMKEKEKECSRCPKIVPLDERIRSTEATLKKEREENKAKLDGLKYIIDQCGEIEEIKQLLAQKTQIEEEIAKTKKLIENQRFVKVRCDMKGGSVVSFGNDCMHCNDSFSCSKYYELTNPTGA